MNMIKVLMVEPGKKPYVKEIKPGLESLQHEVGGQIQAVYPYDDPVALICNEEAKLEGLPPNRALRDEDKNIYDVVAGTFFLAGIDESDFASLSDDLIEKYAEHFKTPEAFKRVGNRIIVYPIITWWQRKRGCQE